MRKRDRLKIKKAQRNVSMHERAASLKTQYKSMKQDVQRKIRTAYWDYIIDHSQCTLLYS